MKVINRIIEPQITKLLESNKVILILGTRRVGKTFYSIQFKRIINQNSFF